MFSAVSMGPRGAGVWVLMEGWRGRLEAENPCDLGRHVNLDGGEGCPGSPRRRGPAPSPLCARNGSEDGKRAPRLFPRSPAQGHLSVPSFLSGHLVLSRRTRSLLSRTVQAHPDRRPGRRP